MVYGSLLPCSQKLNISQINPIHMLQNYDRFILILSSNVCLSFNRFFPSDFPTNILYKYLISPTSLHSLPTSLYSLDEHHFWCTSTNDEVPLYVTVATFVPLPLRSKYCLQHPVLEHLQSTRSIQKVTYVLELKKPN